ncbi:MAG: ABC transporter permease, partial [Methylocystaceae bacterium]|nr:ABC transporter permease [Methylocystaceae bacterium]
MSSLPSASTEIIDESPSESRISVASNWTLIWWRFRKHHLAMASAAILIALYAVVLCPDFFSTQDPEFTEARQAFIPVQGLNIMDGGRIDPWVPAIVGKRNPVTLRMEWKADPNQKVRVGFFVAGTEYKFLGLFKTNVHLIGA